MALTLILQQELQKAIRGNLRFNEPMREHTTIKIGGPADIWVEPLDIEDLLSAVRWADDNDVPRSVFGNGSNTLVRDEGKRGMVISLKNFSHVILSEAKDPVSAVVGAGVNLQQLLSWTVEHSFTGLEPLAGIPGTLGGALIMNAGVKDGTIADAVKSIKYVTKNRKVTVEKEDLEFSYRKLKLPKGVIVVEAELVFGSGDKAEIETKIQKRRKERGEIQPILWPNMGSIFKNPGGASKAWELIDECGLRGVRVGGARVSNEHANWIVNEGRATAKDVEVLIKLIKEKVKDKSGVLLETEIIITGE
ncbi:MAG: UDP-N-acetylenolpyruvoylglucosamine reductase [Deltaproteobacteria bacterium CG11_big_fil_rev_8_21_14_0_20_49_13]|nr:MAG: UDP-N-acetylenolpyruvoylglucosamine reductase [Deltaproteobacteria bacterium CG11_big_fil_rev_8_21_14_0_20_49_13]